MTMSSSNNILQSLSVASTVEKKNRSRRTHHQAKMDSNVANNVLLPMDDKENNIDSIFRLHSTATKQSKVRRDTVKGVSTNSNKKHDVTYNTRTTKDETKDARAASVDSPISIVDDDTALNEMHLADREAPSFIRKFLTVISIIAFIKIADTAAMIGFGTVLIGLLTIPAIKYCYSAGASFMLTVDYVHCFLECIMPFVSTMIMTTTNSSEVTTLWNILTQYNTTRDFLRFRIQLVMHPVTKMDPSKNQDDRRADKDHAAWLCAVCSQVEALIKLFNSKEERRVTNFPVWFTERLECAFQETLDRSLGTTTTTTAAEESPAEDNMVNLINPWGVNISSYQVYERQCILRSLCVDETRLSVPSPLNKETCFR